MRSTAFDRSSPREPDRYELNLSERHHRLIETGLRVARPFVVIYAAICTAAGIPMANTMVYDLPPKDER